MSFVGDEISEEIFHQNVFYRKAYHDLVRHRPSLADVCNQDRLDSGYPLPPHTQQKGFNTEYLHGWPVFLCPQATDRSAEQSPELQLRVCLLICASCVCSSVSFVFRLCFVIVLLWHSVTSHYICSPVGVILYSVLTFSDFSRYICSPVGIIIYH